MGEYDYLLDLADDLFVDDLVPLAVRHVEHCAVPGLVRKIIPIWTKVY